MNTQDLIQIRGNAMSEITSTIKKKICTLMEKNNWTERDAAYRLALNEADVHNMLYSTQKMTLTALLTILIATDSFLEIVDYDFTKNSTKTEDVAETSSEKKVVYDELTRKELCEYVKEHKLDDMIDLDEADRSSIIEFLTEYDKRVANETNETSSKISNQYQQWLTDFVEMLREHPELRKQMLS